MIKSNYLNQLYNKLYNLIFKKLNNIKIDRIEEKESVKEKAISLKHSTALQTVWLLNLKKLYQITSKNLNLNNYHFLDIGCGNGIPLIYAYKNFSFKSYSGFDIISNYVDISKKNVTNSLGINKLEIFQSDAANFILKNKSYFIFMFNPFDEIIMKKFLNNNYENLIKNKSVIAYSNYNQLKVIKKYTKNILTIKEFKLAVCFF